MSNIKIKVLKDAPAFYAQGEYHADLSGAYAEVAPMMAEHLVALGYAEHLKSREKAIEAAGEVPDNAPEFVKRETPDLIDSVTPAQPDAPPIPTEEITIKADTKRGKK